MKAPLLMIAALMGTAAVAQTAPDANAPASTPAASSTDAAATAPTTPPASMDTSSGMANNAQAVPTDTSNYPVCSRSVTDKCVQRGAVHKAHRRHH